LTRKGQYVREDQSRQSSLDLRGAAGAGAVIPFLQIMPWLVDHGLDVGLFVDELFANSVSSFFALDVVMAAITLLVLAFIDRDLSGRQRVAVGLGALLGASVGLPMYLLREWNWQVGEPA
jgi:Terpene cyclase DEP1